MTIEMTFRKVEMTADDGTVLTVGVPDGAIPDADRVATFERAFALVTPDRFNSTCDWKDRIDAVVTSAELHDKNVTIRDVVAAVEFYTATSATVRNVAPPRGTHGICVYHVTALGYRRGPAA